MKKLLTVVFTMLLAGTLAFAQNTGTATDKTAAPTTSKEGTGKKATKTSKAHKGGKKSKKGAPSTTTPPK